jgi:type IV secretory pathway VirB2 component (pilin)
MDAFDQGYGISPLVTAVQWLEALLLGPLALAVGTIAVAAFGFLMLSGRVDVRTGARVVIGCFILFGARSIATGLQAGAAGLGEREASYAAPFTTAATLPEPQSIATPSPQAPAAYDPYAGAAAPTASTTCCE